LQVLRRLDVWIQQKSCKEVRVRPDHTIKHVMLTGGVKMKEIFVGFLCFLCFAENVKGIHRAICPTQPVEAEEGDEVTLPCHLDPPIDLTDYTSDWERVDLKEIVYSYRHKWHHYDAQKKRYRNRTTFNLDGLIRGDVTLRISSVQLDESGPYRCFVPKLNARCALNIIVDGENTTAIAMYACLPLVAILCIIVGVVALFRREIIRMIEKMRGKEEANRPGEIEELQVECNICK
ncbi:butyrophilin-like protein 2 isoform X2, partial [Scomber scombrus]